MKRTVMTTLVMAVMLACSLSVTAADIYMTGSDPAGTYSFNTGANWPGGLAPAAVPGDYFTGPNTLRANGGTFAGNSLTIDGPSGKLVLNTSSWALNLKLNGGTLSTSAGAVLNSGNPAPLSRITLLTDSYFGGGTGTLTSSGIIKGPGGLVISQSVVFGDASGWNAIQSYAGDTVIQNGGILGGAYGYVPWGLGKGNVQIDAGGVFSPFRGSSFNGLSGAGTLNVQAAFAVTLGYNDVNADFLGIVGQTGATGGLTKAGAGTQILRGINTYAGTTTVNGGTLTLGYHTGNSAFGSLVATSPLTFSGTGAFNLDNTGASATRSQSLGALTFSAGEGTVKMTRTADYDQALTFASLAARTAGASGNFVNGGGVNGVNNGFVLTGKAQGFIDKGIFYGGADYASMDGAGTFVRALAYGSDTDTVAADTITADKHVKLTATPANQDSISLLTLNLSGGGVGWTQNAGQTLTVPGILKSGGGAVSTISGGTAVTGGTGVELVIRTDAAADQLTISTPITGTGALTKSGAGTLTLNAVNTYDGTTTVNAGTLAYGLSDAIENARAVTVNGGTLNIGEFSDTVGTVTLTAGSITGTTGKLTGTSFVMNNPAAATVSAILAGAVTLTKTQPGLLTLSGANEYTGATTITGGKILLSGDGTLGASGKNLNMSGGALDLGGKSVTVGAVSITWPPGPTGGAAGVCQSGDVIANGNLTATSYACSVSSYYYNDMWLETIISANLGGSGGMTKSGGSVLVLTGTNTYAGATAINGGAILVTSIKNADGTASSLGAPTSVANGTISIAASGFNGTMLIYAGTGDTTDRVINLSGTAVGTAVLDQSGTGLLKFTSDFTATGAASRTLVLTGATTALGEIAGAIVDNSGVNKTSLTKTGSGTWVLSGPSTYTGTTTVNAGTLKAGAVSVANVSGAFGLNSAVTLANIAGAILDLNGFNTQIGSLAGGGTTGGNVTLGSAILTLGGDNTATSYAGKISGTGGLAKTGVGTQTLTGALNDYSGGTTVSAGKLVTAVAGSLSSAGTVTVNGGGNLSFENAAVSTTTVPGLTLANGAALSFDWVDGAVDKLSTSASATTSGNIGIWLSPSGTPGGTSLVLIEAAGGLDNANYFLLNPAVSATLTKTATTLTVTYGGGATPLSTAYWYGGQVSGASNAMALTDGAAGNWSTTQNPATPTPALPAATADVFFSAAGATQQSNVVLGASMTLNSVTFNDATNVTISADGNSLTLNSAGIGTASAISVNESANINPTLVLGTNQTWTVANSKTLTVGGTVIGTSTLAKSGGGTVTLSAANAYTGDTTVNAGTLLLNGANGALAGTGATALTLNNGATLELDNSTDNNLNRLTGLAPGVSFRGGILRFRGKAGAAASESLGVADIAAGASTIDIVNGSGAGSSSVLTFSSISQTAGASVNFTYSGDGTLGDGGADEPRVIITGQSPGILPYATVNGTSVAEYVAGTGVRALVTTTEFNGAANQAGVNTKFTASRTTESDVLTASRSIGTLTITSPESRLYIDLSTTAVAYNLTVTGGAVLLNGTDNFEIKRTAGTGTIAGTNPSFNIVEAGTTLTISAPISGANTVTKTGAGKLVLSATNTYSGVTTIGGGTMIYGVDNAIAAGAVTINGAGQLELNGKTDTIGAMTIVSTGATADTTPITNTPGSGNLTITTLGITPAADYTTRIDTGTGTLTLGNNVTFTAVTTGRARISGNLALGTVARTFTVNAGTGAEYDLLVDAIVSGGAGIGLAKAGAGTMTLTGTNTYTGATTVSGGVLNIRNITALGTTDAGTTVNNNCVLQLQGGITVGTETLSLNGTGIANDGALRNISGDNEWQGTITLAAAARINSDAGSLTFSAANSITSVNLGLTLGGAGNGTVSGTITTGSGALTKDGTGTWTLMGVNTNSGPATVSGGTLAYGADNVIGTGAVTINGVGAVLAMGTYSDTVGTVTLTAGDITGSGTLTSTGGFTMNNAANTSVGVILAGSVGLTKSAAGTLTLTGANEYTGVTTLSGGILRAQGNASALGQNATAAALTLSGAGAELQLAGDTGLNFGRNATVSQAMKITSDTVTPGSAGVTHMLGTLSIGARVLTVAGGANVTSGTAGLTFGDVTLTGAPTFTVNNPAGGGTTLLTLGAISGGNNAVTVNGTGNTAITGIMGNGSGALNKSGAGTLTLSGADGTYTGLTTVSGGTLAYGADNAIGTGAVTINGVGAVLAMGAYSDSVGLVTLTAGDITGPGTLTSTVSPFTMNNATNTSVSAALAGSVGLTKTLAGTLTLTGTNAYTGVTAINGGVLNIRNNTALGTTDGNTTVAAGCVLQIQDGITVGAEALSLNGTGIGDTGALRNMGGDNVWQGTVTLAAATRINSDAGTLTFNTASTSINIATFGLTLGGPAHGTVGGEITGTTGTLTKDGTGTWTLDGTNTYAGTTTVNAGTLKINGTKSGDGEITVNAGTLMVNGTKNGVGAVTVNAGGSLAGASSSFAGATTIKAGATLSPGPEGSAGGMTFATSLALEAGSTNIFEFTSSPPTNDLVTVTGELTIYVAPINILLYEQGTLNDFATNGSYRLFTCGSIGGPASNLRVANRVAGKFYRFEKIGNDIWLNVLTLGTAAVEWDGGGDPDFNWMAANNWSTDVAPVEGDRLTFAGTTGTVNTNNFVTNSAFSGITFKNDAASFTLKGNPLTLLGGVTNDSANLQTIALNPALDGTIGFDSGAAGITVSGKVTDGGIEGGITKTGSGTLTLGGANANTYTGPTVVNAGTLKANAIDAFGNNSAVTLANADGVVMDITGYATQIGSLAGGGEVGGNVTLGAARLTIGADNTTTTYAGVISGSGGLTKIGTGTQTLSNTNAYTGSTLISSGTLAYGRNDAIGPGAITIGVLDSSAGVLALGAYSDTVGAVTVTRGSITNTTGVLTSTGGFVANGSAGNDAVIDAVLAGDVGLSKSGSGALYLNRLNTYTGATVIGLNANAVYVNTLANGGSPSSIGASGSDAANLVLFGGTLTYTGPAASIDRLFSLTGTTGIANSGTGALTFSNTGSISVTGSLVLTLGGTYAGGDNVLAAVIGGNVGLAKSGAGTWVLAGTNTYTGATMINGGILSVSSLANGGLPSGIGQSGNNGIFLAFGGGSLRYTGASQSTDRGFTLTATGTIDVSNGATTLTITGSGGGGGGLIKAGAGTLILTGLHTYSGATTINGGMLSVSSLADGGVSSGIGASSSAVSSLVLGGGTLQYTGASKSINRSFTLTAGTTGVIDVSNGATTLTITGASANTTGSLVKTGAGTLAMSGVNQHSGSTTISNGTFVLTGQLSASSGTTVSSGATLAGTGTVARAVTVSGRFSPGVPDGDQTGLFTVGGYTNTSTGILSLQIGGTATNESDQVITSGSVNLAGTLEVSVLSGYGPVGLDTFTIIKNTGGGAVTGTFDGLPEGQKFFAGPHAFSITYKGGDGNDVVLNFLYTRGTVFLIK